MTDERDDKIVIEGVDHGGHKFRPSDWAERIAAILASYDEDRRLRYSEDVSPCTIQGTRCLIVAKDLEQRNPDGYQFIMQFANDNSLNIQLDRRSEALDVPAERRA
ncbi:MAG: DUF3579 domain-containing protein [Gammaproteobacteria bacterium]|nr:DUF3579 domain-containing protein [Gammaproteobacteria bacterium]